MVAAKTGDLRRRSMVRVETLNQAAISSSVHCIAASFSSSARLMLAAVPRRAIRCLLDQVGERSRASGFQGQVYVQAWQGFSCPRSIAILRTSHSAPNTAPVRLDGRPGAEPLCPRSRGGNGRFQVDWTLG